jgi:hypothetical protein
LAGVPVKVRVAALNFSHAGSVAPLGELGGVGQAVAVRSVCVVERVGRQRKGEGLVLGRSLVGNRAGQRRRVIGVQRR